MGLRNDSKPAVERARRLRREMTALERALWFRLRCEGLGFKFRRQYPAGPYTLDFYCPAAKLCIEIDGPLHDAARDARRDAYLAAGGILTLRFPSAEVYEDIEPVLERIRLVCGSRAGA